MIEVQCPKCFGHGQVVVPRAVVREDGTVDTREAADICDGCSGTGARWV
jgi:DnaJ-class molecular chaperone